MKQTISNDCIAVNNGCGLRLMRPNKLLHTLYQMKHHSLANIMRQDFCFSLLSTESAIVRANQADVKINGFQSESDMIGKTPFDVFDRPVAELLRHNDVIAMKSNITSIVDQDITRSNGDSFTNMAIETPWYNQDNKLVGLMSFSVVLGEQSTADAINFLRNLNILTLQSPFDYRNMRLTGREKACLQYLLLGRSYKQIAQVLGRSPRTVEHCVESIKVKFGVKTRYQLIEKVQSIA